MARGWTLRVLASVAAITVLATGCSDKQEPRASAPTTTANPSPALPPLGPPGFRVPAKARTQDAPGASAFTAYYVELTNYLLSSLDSQPLRDLSQGCQTCDHLADGYDASKRAGYRYDGGRLTIASAGAATVHEDQAEIAFILNQEAVTVLDSSGQPIPGRQTDAYKLTGGASLSWSQEKQSWIITQFTAERQ